MTSRKLDHFRNYLNSLNNGSVGTPFKKKKQKKVKAKVSRDTRKRPF